jgi:hypothetical protein
MYVRHVCMYVWVSVWVVCMRVCVCVYFLPRLLRLPSKFRTYSDGLVVFSLIVFNE